MKNELEFFGKHLRDLRKRKKLTISDVSKSTGIDIASLSRIENGKMTGTVQSHLRLARALGVRLSDLYDHALAAEDDHNAEPPAVYGQSGQVQAEVMCGPWGDKKMQPLRMVIKAKSRTLEEKHPLGSEKWIYVLRGRVEVVVREITHALGENESLYLNAALPHRLQNPDGRDATVLAIMTNGSAS